MNTSCYNVIPATGVLQVEAMAQLAGIVMLDPEDTAAKVCVWGGTGGQGPEGSWPSGGA
jgi:hypothetical protein